MGLIFSDGLIVLRDPIQFALAFFLGVGRFSAVPVKVEGWNFHESSVAEHQTLSKRCQVLSPAEHFVDSRTHVGSLETGGVRLA